MSDVDEIRKIKDLNRWVIRYTCGVCKSEFPFCVSSGLLNAGLREAMTHALTRPCKPGYHPEKPRVGGPNPFKVGPGYYDSLVAYNGPRNNLKSLPISAVAQSNIEDWFLVNWCRGDVTGVAKDVLFVRRDAEDPRWWYSQKRRKAILNPKNMMYNLVGYCNVCQKQIYTRSMDKGIDAQINMEIECFMHGLMSHSTLAANGVRALGDHLNPGDIGYLGIQQIHTNLEGLDKYVTDTSRLMHNISIDRKEKQEMNTPNPQPNPRRRTLKDLSHYELMDRLSQEQARFEQEQVDMLRDWQSHKIHINRLLTQVENLLEESVRHEENRDRIRKVEEWRDRMVDFFGDEEETEPAVYNIHLGDVHKHVECDHEEKPDLKIERHNNFPKSPDQIPVPRLMFSDPTKDAYYSTTVNAPDPNTKVSSTIFDNPEEAFYPESMLLEVTGDRGVVETDHSSRSMKVYRIRKDDKLRDLNDRAIEIPFSHWDVIIQHFEKYYGVNDVKEDEGNHG